jgi:hypothetical protein
MTLEVTSLDVSAIPELAKLARETAREGRTVVLRVDDIDLAVLSPFSRRRPPQLSPPSLPLPRYPKGGIVAATAGAVQYDGPVLTGEEERDAFERGIAAEVQESLEG